MEVPAKCIFFFSVLFISSCTTVEKTKTTNVYIEIGGSAGLSDAGNQTNKSKKAYSGVQKRTFVSTHMQLAKDTVITRK